MRSSLFLIAILLAPSTSLAADKYKVPRTPFGHPDLQGVWNTHFIMSMESHPEMPMLTVPESESSALAKKLANDLDALASLTLDPELGELYQALAENGLALVRGERRTRQVVVPANGKLPYTVAARRETDDLDRVLATEVNPTVTADHPEQRPNWERCVALQGQPPLSMVSDVNPRRFVQTRDYVLIHTEYGDEVRIIPYTDRHGPEFLPSALGDSIARWEDETLVIETIRLPEKDRMRTFPTLLVPATATVVEKYTRLSNEELLYQYTVIDPVYTAPWLAEYSLYRTDQRMYEFACHEGNYSLPIILRGAREQERREAETRRE